MEFKFLQLDFAKLTGDGKWIMIGHHMAFPEISQLKPTKHPGVYLCIAVGATLIIRRPKSQSITPDPLVRPASQKIFGLLGFSRNTN